MSARERMLARIRASRAETGDAAAAEAARYLGARARSPQPRLDANVSLLFRERALALSSTVDEVASRAEVPRVVTAYLRERNLPLEAVCWRECLDLEWARAGLRVEARTATDADLVGITGAACAIAETGTLVTLTGSTTPPTVSLLPETHIAVLDRQRIVPSMEDAWALIRAEHRALPRAVSFISGPSRTADIEQTVTLGAHGPYRVHVVIVG